MPCMDLGGVLALLRYLVEIALSAAMLELYPNYILLSIQKLPEFSENWLVDLNKIGALSVASDSTITPGHLTRFSR